MSTDRMRERLKAHRLVLKVRDRDTWAYSETEMQMTEGPSSVKWSGLVPPGADVTVRIEHSSAHHAATVAA